MENKRKMKLIFVVVLIIAALAGGVSYYKYVNKYKGTVLEPMENMISSLYFKKGDFELYKNSFTAPNKALNKAQFEYQTKNVKIDKEFIYGEKDTRDVLKHMRLVEKENTALVYYVKNINDDNEIKNSSFWTIEKKNGKWLIKNN